MNKLKVKVASKPSSDGVLAYRQKKISKRLWGKLFGGTQDIVIIIPNSKRVTGIEIIEDKN